MGIVSEQTTITTTWHVDIVGRVDEADDEPKLLDVIS